MIIVTGASRGLGAAVSKRLISNGKDVLGLARNINNIDFHSMECDVSSYNSIKEIVKYIKTNKIKIDALINAAGIASMNLAVTTDQNSVEKLIQTNLIGTIFSCQLFAPLMMRNKRGSIINFSTIAVKLALKGESVYAASKAGVEVFSKTFAREMSDFSINVNCIAPGPIKTDLLKGISNNQINKIISSQIITKIFQKSDLCDVVDLLLDKKSKSISGQVLHIGGV